MYNTLDTRSVLCKEESIKTDSFCVFFYRDRTSCDDELSDAKNSEYVVDTGTFTIVIAKYKTVFSEYFKEEVTLTDDTSYIICKKVDKKIANTIWALYHKKNYGYEGIKFYLDYISCKYETQKSDFYTIGTDYFM